MGDQHGRRRRKYPAERRGMVIGVRERGGAVSGSIVCAAWCAAAQTPLGWRQRLPVGVVPLVLMMFARRGLKETRRFSERSAGRKVSQPLFDILKGPHRKRVLQLGAIWFLSYICTNNAVTFLEEFAMAERGLDHEAPHRTYCHGFVIEPRSATGELFPKRNGVVGSRCTTRTRSPRAARRAFYRPLQDVEQRLADLFGCGAFAEAAASLSGRGRGEHSSPSGTTTTRYNRCANRAAVFEQQRHIARADDRAKTARRAHDPDHHAAALRGYSSAGDDHAGRPFADQEDAPPICSKPNSSRVRRQANKN